MNSALIKTEALCYLRYAKQMEYVCTEGGYWSADVIGSNENFSVEIEIKVSRSDLLAEFRNKKTKHYYYISGLTKWTPNYFYFAVPQDMGEKTVELVKEKFPKAGVLAFHDKGRPGEKMTCLKRAEKLHKAKPEAIFLRSIRKRMASELCGLRVAMDKIKDAGIQTEDLHKHIVETIRECQGAQDWEEVDESDEIQDPVRGK